jgi:hypothetical protein
VLEQISILEVQKLSFSATWAEFTIFCNEVLHNVVIKMVGSPIRRKAGAAGAAVGSTGKKSSAGVDYMSHIFHISIVKGAAIFR